MRFFIVFLLLISLIQAGEYDYTIEVRPGKYECYFQPVDINKHKFMEVDYQVRGLKNVALNAFDLFFVLFILFLLFLYCLNIVLSSGN